MRQPPSRRAIFFGRNIVYTWADSGNWTVSGGVASCTPSLGSDLIVNGSFAADVNWTKGGGWTISGGVAVGTAVSGTSLIQSPNPLTSGTWYTVVWDVVSRTAGTANTFVGTALGASRSTPATYTDTARSASAIFALNGVGGFSGTLDNVSVKAITLASTLRLLTTATPDVYISVSIATLTIGTQAGIALCVDSQSSPANGIKIYLDGTTLKVDKNVGGTWTNLASTAKAFVSNAPLSVVPRIEGGSLKFLVYYNGILVGSELTVSDAGIINNTKHGLFSTYSGNQFSQVTVNGVTVPF